MNSALYQTLVTAERIKCRPGRGRLRSGYGKPPRNAGFKKGQSGNLRGRPPGSKNLTTLPNDALNEPVTITENRRRRNITKREAVIKQLVNKSAALASVAEADAGIALFEAKYTYEFWRPITAIRNGDIDGNPATERDASWQPMNVTPMHPE